MGTLYVIATPIGNRSDLSDRARETLGACSIVAAEDTRHTGQLLTGLGISVRMVSLNEHNVRERLPVLIEALSVGDVGLVSDAGTPTISDPGFQFVNAAHIAGFPVRAIPGASSVVAALSVSGFEATPFSFGGYVPRTAGEQRRWFGDWLGRRVTFVCFESPNRIAKTLAMLAIDFPTATIAICREMTKLHEQIVRGTAAELAAGIETGEIPTKGEFVLVISPGQSSQPVDADALLWAELEAGARPHDAARAVSIKTGQPKRELYARALDLSKPVT